MNPLLAAATWCTSACLARAVAVVSIRLRDRLHKPRRLAPDTWRLDRTVKDTRYAIGWAAPCWKHARWQVGT